MDRIGIIGLGRMGRAMSTRFAGQGRAVHGWTRSGREVPGVTPAASMADLVAEVDVVILSLFDDAAVSDMLDALLAPDMDLRGKLLVETSTVVPTLLTDRIAALEGRGARAVDAPISGGPDLVIAGACGIFVGGAEDAASRAAAALAPLTGRIFHVGPLGTGLVMKTINNAMVQTYSAGLADMLTLAGRAGLPLETALTILSGGPAAMPMIADRIPKILGHDPEVGFPITGMLKDNDVFQRVAAAFGVDAPTLALAAAQQSAAVAAGLGDQDGAALLAAAYADGA